jgi:hypothetical protein
LQGFTKLSQTEYVIEDLDNHREKGKRKIKGAKREFKVKMIFLLLFKVLILILLGYFCQTCPHCWYLPHSS